MIKLSIFGVQYINDFVKQTKIGVLFLWNKKEILRVIFFFTFFSAVEKPKMLCCECKRQITFVPWSVYFGTRPCKSSDFCKACFLKIPHATICPCVSECHIQYIRKLPSVNWMQQNCFFFPNPIIGIILEYLKWQTNKVTTLHLHMYKKLLYKLPKLESISFRIAKGSRDFPADQNFEVDFPQWLRSTNPEKKRWFQIPTMETIEREHQEEITETQEYVAHLAEKLRKSQDNLDRLKQKILEREVFQSWKVVPRRVSKRTRKTTLLNPKQKLLHVLPE